MAVTGLGDEGADAPLDSILSAVRESCDALEGLMDLSDGSTSASGLAAEDEVIEGGESRENFGAGGFSEASQKAMTL